ncbi:hypothetical protein J4467_02405 [Candidatus Woesearchaeota archaeon]|nr:hypothetical protein [Candidatus Woesearchaeota archaeon]
MSCICDGDTDCSDGEYCDESVNSGTCISLEVCDDEIDNDLNNKIDSTGGCDVDSDKNLDYVCGCFSGDLKDFTSYSDCTVNDLISCAVENDCSQSNDNPETYGCFSLEESGYVNSGAENINCESLGGIYYFVDDYCVEEVLVEICDDGIDNDADGLEDCDDSDCEGTNVCEAAGTEDECNESNPCEEGYTCEEGVCVEEIVSGDDVELEICNDGIDNDADGDVDFSGGCDEGSDGDLDFVCGDISETFSSYETIDSEGICTDESASDIGGWYYFEDLVFYASGDYWCVSGSDSIDGIVVAGDSDCGLLGSECNGDYDCSEGYTCEEGVCVEEIVSVDDVELEICNDGIDNDGDGLIDYRSGCDTDGDGLIDYVCGTYDTAQNHNEGYTSYGEVDSTGACDENWYNLDDNSYFDRTVLCGTDEDLDGSVINKDDECSESLECSESNPCEDGYICEDGVCVAEEAGVEEAVCSNVLPECADGVDNDGDGLSDLEDSECTDWEAEESGVTNEVIDDEEEEEDNVDEVKYECNDLEDNDIDNLIDYYGICEYSSGIVSCSELVNVHDYRSLSYMYYDCKNECEKLGGKTTVFDIGCNSTIDDTEKNIESEIKDKIEKNELIWEEIAKLMYDLAQLSEWNEAEIESKYSNYYLDLLLMHIDTGSLGYKMEVKEKEIIPLIENMNIFDAVTLLRSEGNSILKTYEILLSYDIPIDYAAILVVDVYGKDSIDTLAINLKDYGITPIQSGIIAMNLGMDIESFVLKVGYSEEEAVIVKEIVTQSEVVYLVAEGMNFSNISKLEIKSKLIAAGVESNIVDLAIQDLNTNSAIVIAGDSNLGISVANGKMTNVIVNIAKNTNVRFAPEDESLWNRIKGFFSQAYSSLL